MIYIGYGNFDKSVHPKYGMNIDEAWPDFVKMLRCKSEGKKVCGISFLTASEDSIL
jgi:hypothetical protein